MRLSTFLDAVEDMIRSVYRHGFRRLVFLNGHGGNDPARTRISEIIDSLPGLRVGWYSWWSAPSVTLVAEKHGLKSYPAARIEAFPFVRVAGLPDSVKEPPFTKDILGAEGYRKLYGDGVFGGPYKVDIQSWMKFSMLRWKILMIYLPFVKPTFRTKQTAIKRIISPKKMTDSFSKRRYINGQ